jgi:hypothetical protein
MNMNLKWKGTLLLAAMAFAAAMPLALKTAATDAPAVTMTVTAVGKKDKQPPPLTKDDVQPIGGAASPSSSQCSSTIRSKAPSQANGTI